MNATVTRSEHLRTLSVILPREGPVFAYVGRWPCGKHAFRALDAGVRSWDAYEFERRIADWLLNEAEGPTATERPEPRTSPGTLVVLVQRVADVVRFERAFSVDGLTPEAMVP